MLPVASLFRQKTVVYHAPDGRRCTSTTPGAKRSVITSKKWYGEYKDGNGRPVRVPLAESKETARRMLAKLAGDAQLASVGIADSFADHRGRPLLEHVDDFRRFLTARDNCTEHVQKTVAQVRAIIAGCQFETTEDL